MRLGAPKLLHSETSLSLEIRPPRGRVVGGEERGERGGGEESGGGREGESEMLVFLQYLK